MQILQPTAGKSSTLNKGRGRQVMSRRVIVVLANLQIMQFVFVDLRVVVAPRSHKFCDDVIAVSGAAAGSIQAHCGQYWLSPRSGYRANLLWRALVLFVVLDIGAWSLSLLAYIVEVILRNIQMDLRVNYCAYEFVYLPSAHPVMIKFLGF